jgi:hypothetical protein
MRIAAGFNKSVLPRELIVPFAASGSFPARKAVLQKFVRRMGALGWES